MISDKLIKPLFGYKKLIAWQKSDQLAHIVYDLTLLFPREETFGLTSQLRRAVLSIVLNIVEGHARNSKKEFHRFLSISLGSLAETEYLLDFAFKRSYFTQERYQPISLLREEVGHIIWKLFLSQG